MELTGTTPLPVHLQTGVTIAGIWGGMEWFYTQTNSSSVNPIYTTPQPRFPGIYSAPGFETIFEEKYDLPLQVAKESFGHVRLFLDPLVAGKVTSSGYEYPDAVSPSEALEAFLDDVQLCKEKQLHVIINFFPYWISRGHYDHTVTGVSSDLSFPNPPDNYWAKPVSGSDGWKFFVQPNVYPGPWRKDFSMYNGTFVPAVHPLVKTWTQLTKILIQRGFDGNDVTIQPMSEAQVDFTGQTDYFVDSEDADYAGTANNAEGIRRGKWREIQLETIKAIRNVQVAEDIEPADQFRLIVTSNTSLPNSFYNVSQPSAPAAGSLFNKYAVAEFPGADNLIYAFHFYEPFPFTHITNPAVESTKSYFNSSVNDTYSHFPPGTSGTRNDFASLVGTTSPQSYSNQIAGGSGRLKGTMEILDAWRMEQWPHAGMGINNVNYPKSNPMMITEFGAKIQMWQNTWQEPEPGQGAWLPNQLLQDQIQQNAQKHMMRSRWAYDVRKLAEARQYGWTYFSLTGGFRARHGNTFVPNQPTVRDANTGGMPWVDGMQDGLTGVFRP